MKQEKSLKIKTPEILYNQNGEVVQITKGTPAMQCLGGDCYPYTVQDVKLSKSGIVTIFVTRDEPKLRENKAEAILAQDPYEYIERPDSGIIKIKLGTVASRNWRVGYKRYYQDPSF